jgi:hypothetical protein
LCECLQSRSVVLRHSGRTHRAPVLLLVLWQALENLLADEVLNADEPGVGFVTVVDLWPR